jgi:hypothetical protein
MSDSSRKGVSMPARRKFAMTDEIAAATALFRPARGATPPVRQARHAISVRNGSSAGIVACWAAALLDGQRHTGAVDLHRHAFGASPAPLARPLDFEGAVVYRDLTDGLDHIAGAGPAVWMLLLTGTPTGHVMGVEMTHSHLYFLDPHVSEWRWRRSAAVEFVMDVSVRVLEHHPGLDTGHVGFARLTRAV